MRLKTSISSVELAKKLNGRLIGAPDLVLHGINEIHHVEEGDITFVDFHKYYDKALSSAASLILIDQEREAPAGKALIVLAAPFVAYNQLVREQRPLRPLRVAIDPSAKIGPGTIIEPGAVIGPDVQIGEDCHIHANVVIGEGCTVGNRVVVQANTVIGGEAFYFKRTSAGMTPWRSGGSVELQDDVELGPGCSIARGISSTTTIGCGSKLDALVQIGHDCKIGAHCLLAAQVGIAGNTTLGDWCILQGQVGVAQNLNIGERTIILAKSGVGKDTEAGVEYFGIPAQRARSAFRDLAMLRRLKNE
ncbi:MAG: UDP-3-O-(3-hydroxymyristoyl)glucosamine N-acyltransferase [Bacteroidota bacterium]